ncbi:SDR family NAD(P)-dependent oxidoreductase [Vibrio anguillarum]|uniref:SDR family NAD(P)-dependent oxidoreductase n=1 Tax=Vibrio anguillarum TaxID=55601 RepID=UPI00359419D3
MKNAIVTGAARGIGKAITDKLASNGFFVYAFCKNIAGLHDTDCIRYVECDVSDPESVENAFSGLLAESTSIELLVNNAGIQQQVGETEELEYEEWNKLINVNLSSAFSMAKQVIKVMKHQERGCIVNICSIAATKGYPKGTAYSASKAGMIGLTKSLALELAGFNIRVNALLPGLTETDAMNEVPKSVINNIRNQIPLNRIAKPSDIANTVAFLSSEEAEYITGELITLAGGR